MSNHANELMSEAAVVQLLGRGRFGRLTRSGHLIPIRPGSNHYLKSFVELRLREDQRLGGGAAPDATERARRADLIRLPPDVKGTRCANCKFIRDGYCRHPQVDQPIEEPEHECCVHWDAPGTVRVATGAATKSAGGPPKAGPGHDAAGAEIQGRYDPPSLLTVAQAAARLGVGADLIRHFAETGRLTSYPLAGGAPGFRPDVLDREARQLYLLPGEEEQSRATARRLYDGKADKVPARSQDEEHEERLLGKSMARRVRAAMPRPVSPAVAMKLLETEAALQGAGWLPNRVSAPVERKFRQLVASCKKHGIPV